MNFQKWELFSGSPGIVSLNIVSFSVIFEILNLGQEIELQALLFR